MNYVSDVWWEADNILGMLSEDNPHQYFNNPKHQHQLTESVKEHTQSLTKSLSYPTRRPCVVKLKEGQQFFFNIDICLST